MRSTLLAFVIFMVLSPLSVRAQDIAPVTTYIPMIGDHIVFDYHKGGDTTVVDATIANINTSVGAVVINVVLSAKGEEPLKRTLEWFSTPDFIKDNFLGISTQKEILRIGRFNIETVRVKAQGLTFWFAVNPDGSSRYPELIRAVRGDVVLVHLRSITRKK